MKRYAVLTVQKLSRKNLTAIKKRNEHVNRVQNASNINPERTKLDRCIMGPENADWISLYKDCLRGLPYYNSLGSKRLRSDAVIGVEAITTMSHEMAEHVNVEEWCEANNDWMKKYFGEENVVHGVLHMDEGTPHIHYFITPILDGKFNAKELLGNKVKYTAMQTDYANAMEPFGLVRGSQGERLNYLSVQELYRETGEGIEDLPFVLENETAKEYRARANELYRNSQLRENKVSIENKVLSGIKSRNEEFQAIIAAKDQVIAEYEDRLENMEIRGIKVKNIIAAVEKHEDQATISKYLADIASLAEVGEVLLDMEHKEQERQ